MPAHIKALKSCEQELAAVDYNTVKRLFVICNLLKDENTYDSFDQLITEMITRQCPEGFFAQFCEVLKQCPQYEKVAQMLVDEYNLQLPDHNPDRYRQVLRTHASCILQEQGDTAARKALQTLADAFNGIQKLYDIIIEMINHAYRHKRPLEQRLSRNIGELQAVKNNLGSHSSKEEIDAAIRTLLTHLQIIVDIVEGALSSWFNAEEIAVCHIFMKYLAEMVNEMDKKTSKSLPELQKKFTQYCKRLENRISYYKNGPLLGKIVRVVGALAFCVGVTCSAWFLLPAALAVGGYCTCEAVGRYFSKEIQSGEKKGEHLVGKTEKASSS